MLCSIKQATDSSISPANSCKRFTGWIKMLSGLMKRVVITGIGIVSPFGVGKRVLFDNLLSNNIALRNDEKLKIIVGRVAGYGEYGLDLSSWTPRELNQMSRGFSYLHCFLFIC